MVDEDVSSADFLEDRPGSGFGYAPETGMVHRFMRRG
jgi:hypothetical protein